MSRMYILINFFGRGVNWGVVLGIGLSILYYLILFLLPTLYMLYTTIFGAILGILVGGIDGLVLGILTIIFFHNRNNQQNYRPIMLIASVLITSICAATIFYLTLRMYSAIPNADFLPHILLAVAMAVPAAGYATQRISAWYLNL